MVERSQSAMAGNIVTSKNRAPWGARFYGYFL